VEKITVTQNYGRRGENSYVPYLYKKLKERFDLLSSECEMERGKGEDRLIFEGEAGLFPHLKNFAIEHISDVLSIGYKYEFFQRNLSLPMLNEEERFLLYVALVAADYNEDRRYVSRRIGGISTCSLDGIYNFRLNELKERWKEIVECIPSDFGKYSLEGFLEYLIGESEGKIYVKESKVYDGNYRLIDKSELFGEKSVIADVLLCGGNFVYCFGETDRETREFLKKYYKEKVVFC